VKPRALLLLAAALSALAGCSSIQPWVKPYEREHLADPIMAIDPDPVSSAYIEHVFDVREGARPAAGAAAREARLLPHVAGRAAARRGSAGRRAAG